MRRDIFHAIADPTRRAILTLLAMQALTPGLIAQEFSISRQAVSKHIKVLQECALLKEEKRGREIYYQLEVEKMKELDLWIAPFRKLWSQRFDQLDQLLDQLKP